MTGKYSMTEIDTIDNPVVLDETKDIVQEVEKEEENAQHHQEEENSEEWVPGGSLGPFTVAEPVLPETSTVIQCFTYRENQRGLMRFDPPWGLVFTEHNQTESGFVNYFILKGKVDPAILPEVSCRTVASRGFTFDESTRGAAADASHRKQQQQQQQQRNNQGRTGRMYAPELTSTKGIMNSSQLSFVLLVLSAGAYYLYSVHIVPKLAASRKSSTAAAADDLLKNYTDTHGRPKKKNKGGWEKCKKKKSSGNTKKQGRAVIAPQQRLKGTGSQRTSLPSNSNSNSKRNDERLSLEKTNVQGDDTYTDIDVVVAPQKWSKGSSVVSLSNSKRNDERLSLEKTTLDKTTNVQSDADTDIDTTDDGNDIVGLNVARSDDSTSDISSLLSVHDVEGTVSSRPKPEHNPTKVLEGPPVVSKDDGETTIENSAQATAETNNNDEKNTKTLTTKELLTDSETIDSAQKTSAATREEEEEGKKDEKQRKKPEESLTRSMAKQAATEEKSRQAEANAIDATTNDLVEGLTIEIASAKLEQQNPETISLPESSRTIRISEEQDLSAEVSTPDIPLQEKEKPTTDESIHSNDSVVNATADHATASKLNHKISPPPGLPPLPVKVKPVPIAAAGSSSSVTSSSSSSSSSSSPSSKQKNMIVLLIEGMTCGGCVKVVNRVLNSFDEIDSVNTDLKTCKSTLLCNVPRLNLLPILTALDDVGMQAYLQSQSVAPPLPDQSNDANNASAPLPGTPPAKCPLVEQAEKQQTLGAIGARPLLTSELGPFASSVQKPASALSLMDELRVGSTPLRRYQCSCGCEGCICSARQVHKNDNGTDISLTEFCNRLETTMGTTKLEETFRKTGGSLELRNKLEEVAFPCGCSDME